MKIPVTLPLVFFTVIPMKILVTLPLVFFTVIPMKILVTLPLVFFTVIPMKIPVTNPKELFHCYSTGFCCCCCFIKEHHWYCFKKSMAILSYIILDISVDFLVTLVDRLVCSL